ncbi:Mitochondrial inner membrane protein COX18, partial [Eschrichtius robustus]|nr:Mitochondrial inner membrane protein COX18 [Eschrichtius robustus]
MRVAASAERWLQPRPALQLRGLGPPAAPAPTGGPKPSALPLWAVASVSAVGPSGAGGWYEALATSAPVQGAEDVLLFAHTASGLPWWGSILLTTMALRGAVTLPLAAYQHYILAKVENLQPEIKNIARHLNQEVAVRANQLGWSKRAASFSSKKFFCFTYKHVSAGFSVQEQLATGGVLWFPDLTALDSTWILPVSIGVINLLIVE